MKRPAHTVLLTDHASLLDALRRVYHAEPYPLLLARDAGSR